MKKIYVYTTNTERQRYLKHLKDVIIDAPYFKVTLGHCTIPKGYSWNGCTPKFKVFGKVFGTPDGRYDQCKEGTLWHDPQYQYSDLISAQGVKRESVDSLFKQDMIAAKWKYEKVYYFFVRLFGRFTWKDTSQ